MAKRGKSKPQPAEVDPRRDAKGRILPGHTLNPGGVPKQALELRKQALADAPEALRVAREMMRSDNPLAQNFGITHILNRALGKDGSASDLPDDDAGPPEQIDTSPAALHALATEGFAIALDTLRRRAHSRSLTAIEVELQARAASALSTLLKEEREIAKGGAGAALPDAELLEKVLASVPMEKLLAAIEARKAAGDAG